MLLPSLMTSTLLGLQRIVQKNRIIESSTSLSASSARRSFGQLVSADLEFLSRMNDPSCPCCSFGGRNLFLPWDDTKDTGVESVRGVGGKLSAAAATGDVMSPVEAWQTIISARADGEQVLQPIALVDTHGHPHLERKVEYASQGGDELLFSKNDEANVVVSVTCAVSPADWSDALEYACNSQQILPALGVHPWYLGDIQIKQKILESKDNESNTDEPSNIEQFLHWEWLSELETKLSQHPNLIVGEIGLCKMARFVREFPKVLGGKATALQLQKIVFKKQMKLAANWKRPVTVHCVNAHGMMMETLKELLHEAEEQERMHSNDINNSSENDSMATVRRNAFPSAIALHSFTGTSHHVQQILDFERQILYPELVQARGKKQRGKKHQEGKDFQSGTDILFYFGFSHSVNYVMCTSEKAKHKGVEAVQAIPSDRLLIESDVHATEDVILGTAGAAAYAAHARGESLELVAKKTTRNGLRFISSLSSGT